MKTKIALLKCAALLVLLLILNFPPSAHAQGTAFTYQGRLNDGAGPANGLYTFGFLLRDAASGGSLLGNMSQPDVGVTNGLFSVPLDFGNKFDGSPRWLQITVATNGGIPTILHPYQPLTPTPYAILAGSVANGAIDTPQLAGGAVTAFKLGTNAVTNAKIADGAVDTLQLAGGAVTTLKLASNAVTSGKIADGAVGSAQLASSISLGTSNVNGRLDVYRTAANTTAISLIGSGGLINSYGDDGLLKARMESASYGGRLTTWDDLGNETAHVGSATDAGGVLGLYQKNGSLGVNLDGDSTGTNGGGFLRLFKGDGTPGLTLQADVNGESKITTEVLQITGSGIKVPGAGIGTSTPVFVHRVTGANIEAVAPHRTTITHPLCDGDPNAILIITHILNPGGAQSGVLEVNPTSVSYNPSLSKWQIYHDNLAVMSIGSAWNVLIVKP